MVTLKEIASECGIELSIVKNVLKEQSDPTEVPKKTQDQIFQTARKLGYNFKKLRVGKRMQYRKDTVAEILAHLDKNPDWGRDEIVKYLKSMTGMVERVQKRAFKEEFGEEGWIKGSTQ